MKKSLPKIFWILSGLLLLLFSDRVNGQGISLTTLGSAYSQSFDVLSNTDGSTTNNLTIHGWFMTESGGGARDNEQYAVGTGSDNTGDTYSFGAASSTDRALGGLRSGTLIPIFGALFTNNTGATIGRLDIRYTGEQWRLGTAGRTDKLNFEYSTNATSLTTGNWAPIADLDFLSPETTTVGAKNGNDAANRIALSTTINGQNIPNGASFWVRWTDTDATNNDDGLAVDDFSLTPQAVVTPSLSINDVSQNEGNAGTTTFTYSVSLSSPAGPGGVTFDIATADGTATAPSDYTAKSLTGQTIPAGSSTYAFSVLVNGETSVETDETFFVNVTNVTGANVTDGQGVGTIVNDDAAPNLVINDVTLIEGNAGTTSFNFIVSLSSPAGPGGVTFDIATADGTATAPGDYTAKSLTGHTMTPGSATYAFSVLVNGETSVETDETFFVNITNVTGANVTDGQGVGTIVNDDTAPVISATLAGSSTICSGQAAILTVTITNGDSPYELTISDGMSTSVISGYVSGAAIVVNPSGTTTYTISALSDANGRSASSDNLSGNAVITIDEITATLSPSEATITCSQPTVSLTATGGTSYTLSDGQMNTTGVFPVSTPGPYTVIVANASGCTAIAATYVSIDDSTPEASLEADGSLSCASPSVTLTARPYEQINYVFSEGAFQPEGPASNIAIVTQAGTYSVIITGYNGCTATASVTVEFEDLSPTVSINPTSATLSCTNPLVELTASGEGQLLWSTGETSSFISVTAAGTYSVTLNPGSGCSATAVAEISQDNTAPSVSISPSSATLGCGTSSVTLNAVGVGTYQWSTGATSQSIDVTMAGTYSVVVTGTNGCTATASAQVFQDNTAPLVSINPTSATLSCANSSVTLNAVGNGTYQWSTGATTQSISATAIGAYSVTLTGGNGCTAVATAQVFQDNTAPSVSINPTSATLNCGSPSATLMANGVGTYRWSTGVTSQTIAVNTSGTYSVTVTNGNGCSATASAEVYQDNSVPQVSISPSSATLNCTNTSVTLNAVGVGTYRWSTGATSQNIDVTMAGTYSIVVTGTNGCTATASAQVFQDNTAPSVSINPSSATLSCTNTSVTLNAVGNGTYQWSTGATSFSISVNTGGTYSVTLTTGNGCKATATVEVSQDNSMPSVSISAVPSLTIAAGQSTTLTASGASTYLWSTGAATTFIVVNTAGNYSVTGTTGNCMAQALVVVSEANVPAGPFAITAVTTNACTQISNNRYVIGFTPQYSGVNGQPISVSVANEMFPTTAPGPYSLQLYNDNPTIIVKAQQSGTSGEASFTYNWLANCRSPQPNTPPRVSQPLTDQVAKVGEGFGYTIPQNTFTDNESPHTLVLSVSGLPAGLSFSPPTQIGGIPSMTGVSSVTVTATDPQGLSVSASFVLTVVEPSATNTPPVLVNPIPNQVAIQEQPFGLNVANTFTDAQTPTALTLMASGLPTGLNLVGTTITGTPSLSGTSTVTLTATDPGGLTASTQFGLTVQPASATASAPFTIVGVSSLACTQISHNRYEISFQPQYSGLNGQPVSLSVVNEMFPTTASGPYSLQLYNDNPTIILKAMQQGSAGEASFTYNWLANCRSPQPNTSPRLNQPLTDQMAKVGQEFGYTIPQTTFTDNESPHTLVLSVSGLPAGLSFSPPTQIGGIPSMTGVSSVTVTATDPQGLSVSASFVLTVSPVNSQTVNPESFAITGVQTLSCVTVNNGLKSVRFLPQYSNVNGQPILFSVVNELLPTTAAGPYTLQLYTDNPVIMLKATQQGSSGEVTFSYNWLAGCSNPVGREGLGDLPALQVIVLGNPVVDEQLDVEVRNGQGQFVNLTVINEQGNSVSQLKKVLPTNTERLRLTLGKNAGIYLLQVISPGHRQTIKLLKQ